MSKIFKVIIVGDNIVGKSSIISRYVKNEFVNNKSLTIGVDFQSKHIGDITLHIWDLGGSTSYGKIVKPFFHGANGLIVVFDLTNPTSFQNVEKWIDMVYDITGLIPTIMIGNKNDLPAQIPTTEIENICQKHNLEYVETNAKYNCNICNAFNALIYKMQSKPNNEESSKNKKFYQHIVCGFC